MVPSLQTNKTKSSSAVRRRRRRTHKPRPSQPLQSMQRSSPPQLQTALHKQARSDVSALAFDKSRMYIPLFSAKRNNSLFIRHFSAKRDNRTHTNHRTGSDLRSYRNNPPDRYDLIKLFIYAMSCIVSDHKQIYNGSK